MVDDPPVHEFDEASARRYRPNPQHSKIAILVDVVDDSTTVINAKFGVQRFRGPFYIVAEGDQSYGVARREFESSHEATGPNQWRKNEPVLAYRAGELNTVETNIDGQVETTVTARPGDWIVRQASGELMVVDDHEFVDRYVVDSDDTDRAEGHSTPA